MMFKIHTLLCVLVLSTTTLIANDYLIEAKGAYFLPSNSQFRDIYSGGIQGGAEMSYRTFKSFYTWASIDYFSKSGSTLGCRHRTHISLVPIGLGVKYFLPYQFRFANFYVGGGVTGTYSRIHDHSAYVIQRNNKGTIGGIAKIGALLSFNRVFVDLFINYAYTPMSFHNTAGGKVSRKRTDLGGVLFGLGFGFKSNP